MKNAHERFGFAEFEKRLKDTTTRIRLTADCFIGEPADKVALPKATCFPSSAPTLRLRRSGLPSSARNASVSAAPNMMPYLVMFGERPSVYRGTLTLPGRRRPIRHLVVLSTQFRAEGDQARIIVKGNSPALILRAAANFHGLPLLASWDEWFFARLRKAGRMRPLSGLNCDPVAIRGTKTEFLEWIGAGLKLGQIQIPTM